MPDLPDSLLGDVRRAKVSQTPEATMKRLPPDTKCGTFKLDGIDIGDYLEAESGPDHGVVDTYVGLNGQTMSASGHELMLTFSCDNVDAEPVLFVTGSNVIRSMLTGREPGEKLVLTSHQMKNRHFTWCVLRVNGDVPTFNGRRIK